MEAAVVEAACLTRVLLPLRKWPMGRTRAWSAPRLTPSPLLLKGACLLTDVTEEEQRLWVQSGTIPVTVMRDAPHGGQNRGRE